MVDKKIPDNKEAMRFHWSIERRIREKYGFSEQMKARWIANRKNIQISLLTAEVKPWEMEAITHYGIKPTFISHRSLILDVIRKEFIHELRDFYQTIVKQVYLFEPQFFDNILFTFTLKTFEMPIFKSSDAYQLPEEEKLVNIISKYIKEVNGIGPSKVQVAILSQSYLVVIGNKIFSDFQLSECKECPAKLETFCGLTSKLLFDAISYACEITGRRVYSHFTECNTDENSCIQLMTLRAHNKEELLQLPDL